MSSPELVQTSQALNDLSSQIRSSGLHISEKVAYQGIPLYNEVFDPLRHQVRDIDPFAEETFGLPMVQRSISYGGLAIKLVLDVQPNPVPRNIPELALLNQVKEEATRNLVSGLYNSASLGDKVEVVKFDNSFGVGIDRVDNESVIKTKSAQDKARILAEESYGADYTFLISDFVSLYPSDYPNPRPFSVVSLFLSHPLERELPPKIGRVSMGGGEEANTNNPRSLAKENQRLSERTQTITTQLRRMRQSPVDVIVSTDQFGFNLKGTDRKIAQALRKAK